MHYYKRNIGDYAKKAGRLTMLQHGSYTLLIDACYDREVFPTMEEAIEWTWASNTAETEAVEFVLRKFFELKDGRYVQARIQEEIDAYQKNCENNARIATEREEKRRGSSPIRARSVHEATPNQEPLTTNHKPVTKNQEPKKTKSKASATGSRLPADWRPTDADIEYCKTERPDLRPSLVATNFYDYWIAKAGAAGRKVDWSATWRTWVRKESATTAGRAVGSPVTRGQPDLDEVRRRNNEEAKRLLGFGTTTHDEERTIDV